MTIGGVLLPLSDASQVDYQELTSDFIVRSVVRVLGKDTIENLEIKVSLIPPTTVTRRVDEVFDRELDNNDDETLSFDVLFLIQSVFELHDANRYIVGAFNENAEKMSFLNHLRLTGHKEFANVETMSVTPAANVEVLNSQFSDSKTAAIVVAPILAAVLLVIAGIVLYKRRRIIPIIRRKQIYRKKKKQHDEVQDINAKVNTTMDTSAAALDVSFTSDFIMDTGVDVSSLGDGASFLESDGPSRISGASMDFDFDDIFPSDDNESNLLSTIDSRLAEVKNK